MSEQNQTDEPKPIIDGPVIPVETGAPIDVALLRRKYTENLLFIIDYSKSRFKGKVLINFLNNLELNCKLKLPDQEGALELVAAYLNHATMADIPDLADIVMNMMLAVAGEENFLAIDQVLFQQFLVDNRDILNTWFRRVASLGLYAYYVNPQVERTYIEQFPVDEDASLPGINFVHLIKHPLWPLLASKIPQQAYTYNHVFFNEYIFGGKNLMYYFSHPENPLCMATITQESDLTDELKQALAAPQEE